MCWRNSCSNGIKSDQKFSNVESTESENSFVVFCSKKPCTSSSLWVVANSSLFNAFFSHWLTLLGCGIVSAPLCLREDFMKALYPTRVWYDRSVVWYYAGYIFMARVAFVGGIFDCKRWALRNHCFKVDYSRSFYRLWPHTCPEWKQLRCGELYLKGETKSNRSFDQHLQFLHIRVAPRVPLLELVNLPSRPYRGQLLWWCCPGFSSPFINTPNCALLYLSRLAQHYSDSYNLQSRCSWNH